MSIYTFDNLIFAADKVKQNNDSVEITIGSPELILPCVIIKHNITTITLLPGRDPTCDLIMFTSFEPEPDESYGVLGELDNAFTVEPSLVSNVAVNVYMAIPDRKETADGDKVITDALAQVFDAVVM